MATGVRLRRSSARHLMVVAGGTSLLTAGFVLAAGPASAHTSQITGRAPCAVNGYYTVTWTVANNRSARGWHFTISGSAPAGASFAPTSVNGVGPSSFTITQTGVPAAATTASLTGSTTWSDGFHVNATGVVHLGENCTTPTSSAPATIAQTSSTAPGTTAPGTTAPGTTAPVTTAPGTTAPGTTAPGTTAPGTTAPGTTAPGTTAPGTTAPVTTTPVTTAPTSVSVSISSFVNPPPVQSTTSSSAVISPEITSAVNNPPSPSGAILPMETTNVVATSAASGGIEDLTVTQSPAAQALASTGPHGSVPRTVGIAALFAALGSLLIFAGRRRYQP